MPIPSVYGHEALLGRLEAALVSGRFPQTVLFVGPPGAGKQRLALWVAQSLLCSSAGTPPCGTCVDCRQVLELTHPDLHWFVPIARPKATDPAKQVDEARELIGEAIAERRKTGLYRPVDGQASHPLASVRALQRVIGLTPFRGGRKVVILAEAERLVVQEASQEAANALLKVLEEPPADTTLLLTAAEPRALLPTIRSRVVRIRVGPVGDEQVRAFLAREVSPPPKGGALARRVAAAGGLIGPALWADDRGADAGAARADAVLQAAAGGPDRWAAVALGQAPWGAREFAGTLDALAVRLRDGLAEAGRRGDRARVARGLRALRAVEDARESTGTNVNPQLALAVLARELERAE